MTGCVTTNHAGAPEGEIDIIAHRGASAYAPENTLASFEKAVELKADWFELDCTLSKDGEVVVIHDDDLLRTTGVSRAVADTDYGEISRYDAGTWFSPEFSGERIPTLAQALDLAKGRIGVYIEVKDSGGDADLLDQLLETGKDYDRFYPEYERLVMRQVRSAGSRNIELAEKVVQLVREREMREDVVIMSFSPIVCAVVMSKAPELRVEFLAASSKEDPGQWPRALEWLRLLNPAGFNPGKDDVTPELVRQLHSEGRSIAVWTVNEEADMRRLKTWGVDSLITNYPDVGLQVLERKN